MTQNSEPKTVIQRSLSPHKNPENPYSRERFPSFDAGRSDPQLNNGSAIVESPSESSPSLGNFSHPDFKWPSRKTSQRLRDARPPGVFGHRSKRSVSDAINKFRTRQGSVSENAQELAEALKAPVSYKLIVSPFFAYWPCDMLTLTRFSASLGT